MRTNIISLMIAAFAAVSFVSCQKDPFVQTEKTVMMRLHASSSTVDTRTIVSENSNGGYDINWRSGDQVQVIEFVDNAFSQTKTSTKLENDSQKATFGVTLVENIGTSFLYETVYPASAYSTSTGENLFYRLNLSDKQTFASTSYDGSADLLISEPISINEQPTELNLKFKRIGAAGRMVLKGITAGETITKVVFSTDDGYIAGYSKFDPTTAGFIGTYNASKKSIELTPSSTMTATGADIVWFRLYAITLTDNFKVVVTTDAATYTKEVNLASSGRELAFYDGGLTKFNVAFAADNRHENKTASYIKVTETPTDWTGEYILVYEEDKKTAYCWTGIDAVKCFVSTSIINDEITTIPAGAATLSIEPISGGYSIKVNGGASDGKFISMSKFDNGISYSETAIKNTLQINEGSVVITGYSGSDGTCIMRFNRNSDQMRFRYYKSIQEGVQLYKLDDNKQSQSLSFGSTTEFNITLGEGFVAPLLSGSITDVTYSSSNTDVATVDQTSGAISIVGTGTTTITAKAIDNSEYRAASAFYTIIVKAQGEDINDNEPVVLIIDGSKLTSTATTKETEILFDNNVIIKFSDGAKYQASSGDNKFTGNAILIGKTGKYIYNSTPIPGKITKFEIYANKGASAKVSVGVQFSDSALSEYSTGSNTYTATLSTLDNVYDCSSKITSNCKYFWYQVTNANNSQIQFRITYIPDKN